MHRVVPRMVVALCCTLQPCVQSSMALYAVSQLLKLGQCCRLSMCTTAMSVNEYVARLDEFTSTLLSLSSKLADPLLSASCLRHVPAPIQDVLTLKTASGVYAV